MSEQRVNIKLVAEVKKRPLLYNFKLPGYTRRDETEKAWTEVGKAVNMTVSECKQRWKNLRAVFCRHMKPHKSGVGGKPKKAYYLMEAMQFTIPFIKALDISPGNVLNPSEESEDGQVEDIDFDVTVGLDSGPSSPIELPPSPPPPLDTSSTDFPRRKEHINNSQYEQMPSNMSVPKNIKEEASGTEYVQIKKSRTSTSGRANQESKNEALKMFLLSMLPDLQTMSDDEVRLFKRKALQIVDDIFTARLMTTTPQVAYSPSSSTTSPNPK